MIRISNSAHKTVILSLLLLAAMTSVSQGDQLIFSDDFSEGSGNWLPQIGEWYLGGQTYCVDYCGS